MAGEPTTPRNACVAATEAEKTDRRASAPDVVALGGGAAAAAAALRAARPRRHSWSAVKGSVAKARAAQALTESAKEAAWARAGRLTQLGWAATARVRAAVAWSVGP